LDQRDVVAGEPGRSGPVYNPAAGIQTGEVDFASAEEVDRAVQAAKEAFASWRAVSLSRKTEIFFRIRALVDAHREDIAKILTAEHGKVLSDAKGEVARGLEVIEFCWRDPRAVEGRLQPSRPRPGSTSIRSGSRSRLRGDHAVQLPGHGPDVDVGAGARLPQHVRPQAVREGPFCVDLHG